MARIGVETRDGVAVVRFTNPPPGYMDATMVAELAPVVDALLADPAVRVLVFTGGVEGVFIRHYDVGELKALADRLRAKGARFTEDRPSPEGAYHAILRRLEGAPKPAIAAINGPAMGGGFEFCMACDLRIAQRGPFWLGQPEVNIGILAGAGGTQRLVRLVGEARALELSLTGRTVSPDQAQALGMVHEVVEGPVLDRALALARHLATRSPRALAHIKRLVRGAAQTPLDRGLALERTLFMDLLVSDEAQAPMAGMVEGGKSIRD